MITFLLILLVIGIVLFTHFVVTYLIENELKIIGVAMGFIGVIAAIIIVYFIVSNITGFVADELGLFYND
ncbi:hypothetical protein [Corticicoccus populi]|uniref:Uncharacterized protein n=1 Tax=Corticicoccus populi TaxID=1812821 RepID=A0ABW5WU19_9STAP